MVYDSILITELYVSISTLFCHHFNGYILYLHIFITAEKLKLFIFHSLAIVELMKCMPYLKIPAHLLISCAIVMCSALVVLCYVRKPLEMTHTSRHNLMSYNYSHYKTITFIHL